MLTMAVRFVTGKQWVRWIGLLAAVFSAPVCVFEVWMISKYKPGAVDSHELQNYVILLSAGILMILFSVLALRKNREQKWENMTVMYIFSFVCINFGIILSAHAYERGEQILTFLTMELFVICLLIWKPLIGFLVLTGSYLIFFGRLGTLVAFNTGTVGITESTQINGFTMWLSTLMFCIANYNKTLSQALKDEHLEKMNAHLSEISIKDELTGIHNMLYFRTEAERLLGYVTTDRESIIYLFMDIENFKSYNEKYGFHAGNEVLIQIANAIETCFKGSLVSRFSDDHFVVLTRKDGCMEKIARISEEIKKCQREVHLELKCGAYQPVGDEADPSLACDRARFACNSIKKHYDRSFRYYDKSLEDKFQLKQYIVNNIDNAIENGYIKVYYQPVVSTETGKICGLEALARWQDPNYGLLPPGAFIEILEEYRQIYKLDRYIIEQVCRDYVESVKTGQPFVPVSLNFSRLDFELCDIVGHLTETVQRYQVPKEYMEIEITESALTDQQDFLPEAIRKLRKNGYNVWLDDFGSGYSSLNVLKDYQFDVLKIDMKFLSGFESNKKTMPIIKNIISLTQQLEMISLTEGVETQEQFAFLRSIGCNRAQGYLFGKPMPLAELRERIRNGLIAVAPEFLNA
ncbi:MAG: EAL domain-containing protein [Oscillospiraceae bacterium]|nr:EAL domain-containing protein [Oscillospiraceae bacterium]